MSDQSLDLACPECGHAGFNWVVRQAHGGNIRWFPERQAYDEEATDRGPILGSETDEWCMCSRCEAELSIDSLIPEVGSVFPAKHVEPANDIGGYPDSIDHVEVTGIRDGYVDLDMLTESGDIAAQRNIAAYRVRATLDEHDGAYAVVVQA